MKVLHVITGLGVGGAERMLVNVVPRLKGDHVVCVITADNELASKLVAAKIKIHYLKLNRFNVLGAAMRLRSIIRSERPDIVNSYLLHANIFTTVVARLSGVSRIICSVRNIHRNRWLLNLATRIISPLVTIFTPNSAPVAQHLNQDLGISERKIHLIPNGLDFEEFDKLLAACKRDKLRRALKVKGYMILCVATFKAQKAHEDLLRAMRKIDIDCTLFLAGTGSRLRQMKQLARELQLENVRFLGKRQDIPCLLSAADCFVLPSLHEGMSNALLEAAAAKVPIVCTDLPENRFVLHDHARFCVPHNPTHLAQEISKCLSADNTRLVTLARKYVLQFDTNITVEKLNILYGGLL